jgi:hypothetical protein
MKRTKTDGRTAREMNMHEFVHFSSKYMRKAQENFVATWDTKLRHSLRRAGFSYMAVRVV